MVRVGLTDVVLDKPEIAVVNRSSELASCFRHLDDVAETGTDAIWSAGHVPFEIRTAPPSVVIVSAGDPISIDVDERRIALDVDADELARRRETEGEPELPESSGRLSIYQRAVQPMSTGAVLVETDEDSPSRVDAGGAEDD